MAEAERESGDMQREGWLAHRAGAERLRYVQVLGERASGTNYLSYLLAHNTDLTPVSVVDWKHAVPSAILLPHSLLLAVSVRSPLDWVRSMHGRPWHAAPHLHGLTLREFATSEWAGTIDEMLITPFLVTVRVQRSGGGRMARLMTRITGRTPTSQLRRALRARSDRLIGLPLQHDLHPIEGRRYRNLLEMRAVKHRAWLGLRNRSVNVLFVRHEVLRADPGGVLAAALAPFGIALRPELSLPDRHLGGMPSWLRAAKGGGSAEAAPPTAPDEAELAAILAPHLDADLERSLGYGEAAPDLGEVAT